MGAFRDVEYYRGRSPEFTDEEIGRRGARVAKEVADAESLLGAEESLAPEQTVVLRHTETGPGGRSESMVVAVSVFVRRYVDGLPIVGTEGLIKVQFDADGSLVDIDYPLTRYERVGEGHPGEPDGRSADARSAGRAQLERGLVRAGFDRLPRARTERVQKGNGDARVVHDLLCGFVSGSDRELVPGCALDTVGQNGGERTIVVSEE